MSQQDDNRAEDQARAQMAHINRMLAACELDWDRLEELRDERASLSDEVETAETEADKIEAAAALLCWDDENASELAELESGAGEYESQDDAEEAIYNNPLDIQFRSGWTSSREDMQPEEFYILLCTGGPAVRIIGELDNYGEPYRAWVEFQDWGTPWTFLCEYQSTALEYAQRLIQL